MIFLEMAVKHDTTGIFYILTYTPSKCRTLKIICPLCKEKPKSRNKHYSSPFGQRGHHHQHHYIITSSYAGHKEASPAVHC